MSLLNEEKNLVKSKNYKGVFYYFKEGKKIYLYKYNHKCVVDGAEVILKKQKIVGYESDGITEKIAFLEKIKSQESLKNEVKRKKEYIPTLNELADKYFATTDAKSKKQMQQGYNKYIKNSSFAKIPVSPKIRLAVLEFRNSLLGKLSKKTINDYITLITLILNFGIDNNLDKGVFANHPYPTFKCRFKKANLKREGYLSEEDCRLLLDTVRNHKDKHLYLFVIIAIYTGARFQSILNIQKKDINFDRSFINIGNTKNKTTYASYFNEKIGAILYSRASLLNNPNDYLFQDEGVRINAKCFQSRLLKILDKLFNQGLDKKDTVHRIVIHSLRHTLASLMAMQGASMLMIQKQLDHSSEHQSKVYTKLSPESVTSYVTKLDFGV